MGEKDFHHDAEELFQPKTTTIQDTSKKLPKWCKSATKAFEGKKLSWKN